MIRKTFLQKVKKVLTALLTTVSTRFINVFYGLLVTYCWVHIKTMINSSAALANYLQQQKRAQASALER